MTRTAVWQAGPWNRTLTRRLYNRALDRRTCKCTHHRQAHTHFRPGPVSRWRTSIVLGRCGLCACLHYRRRR